MQTRWSGAADHERIAAAITAAEARTSGEIYCVVTHAVATYRWIPVTLAAVAVTVEPEAGSLAPTTKPIIVAPLT